VGDGVTHIEYLCDVCHEPAALRLTVQRLPPPTEWRNLDHEYGPSPHSWSPDLCQRHADELVWRDGRLIVESALSEVTA
jgi:hypothetical protein